MKYRATFYLSCLPLLTKTFHKVGVSIKLKKTHKEWVNKSIFSYS